MDQWVKARDGSGQLGYVPENYLEFPPVATQPHHQYALPPGDENENVSDTASISTSGTSSLTTTSSSSGYDKEVSKITSKSQNGGESIAVLHYLFSSALLIAFIMHCEL